MVTSVFLGSTVLLLTLAVVVVCSSESSEYYGWQRGWLARKREESTR